MKFGLQSCLRGVKAVGMMLGGQGAMKGMQAMGWPVGLSTLSVVVTLHLVSLTPWQAALAEMPDEEETPTSADIAMSAGTAAGLVEACSVDVTPIESAFKEFIAQANLPSSGQQSLVDKFKAAEREALAAIAEADSNSCTDATGLMRETVHSLTKGAS